MAAASRPCSSCARDDTDVRRDRLLRSSATRRGMDRDEYPPAVGRAAVRASVAYVPVVGEPLPRRDARDQAPPLLRRHAVPLRLLLIRLGRQPGLRFRELVDPEALGLARAAGRTARRAPGASSPRR